MAAPVDRAGGAGDLPRLSMWDHIRIDFNTFFRNLGPELWGRTKRAATRGVVGSHVGLEETKKHFGRATEELFREAQNGTLGSEWQEFARGKTLEEFKQALIERGRR